MYRKMLNKALTQAGIRATTKQLNTAASVLEEEMLTLLHASVPQRLARYILAVTADADYPTVCEHEHAGNYDFTITQDTLARMIGGSRSFISSVINSWKSDGVLRSVGRTTCVKDVKALRKLAY